MISKMSGSGHCTGSSAKQTKKTDKQTDGPTNKINNPTLRPTALAQVSGLLCLPLVFQVSAVQHQIQDHIWIIDHHNFSALPGLALPDLIAGLSVAGLALVTILTVCLATVLLVRRCATGDFDDEEGGDNDLPL